jgi:ATP-binding cassette subfamily F protein uup
VVTSIVVMDGMGGVEERVGSYSDWEAAGGRLAPPPGQPPEDKPPKPRPAPKKKRTPGKRLSYKDQRELEALPQKIEQLEQQQTALEGRMAEPGFFESDPATVREATGQLAELQAQLEAAFERWGELEAQQGE